MSTNAAEIEGVRVPLDHYIDGRRVASETTFEVRSPIDWESWKLAEVAAGGQAEVDAAVAAARRAFPEWAALGPDGRHTHLTRLADAIDAAVPDLAKVECVDNGSLYEAMHLRVLPRAANNIRFFADFARDRLAPGARTLHGGERNRVRYDPAGVVAVSTPWNAPFMLATWRVGPALAAGNTVVLKPPEWAPLTCSLLGDLAEQAGLPPGVLNIVHGTGAGAGAPLTGHTDVDRVAFTGSPATAHTVYRDAAAQPDAGVVRARRQVAVHRVRRRRPRRGGGDRRLPVRQLRPGVPGRDAPPRSDHDPRRVPRALRSPDRRDRSATRASPTPPTAR